MCASTDLRSHQLCSNIIERLDLSSSQTSFLPSSKTAISHNHKKSDEPGSFEDDLQLTDNVSGQRLFGFEKCSYSESENEPIDKAETLSDRIFGFEQFKWSEVSDQNSPLIELSTGHRLLLNKLHTTLNANNPFTDQSKNEKREFDMTKKELNPELQEISQNENSVPMTSSSRDWLTLTQLKDRLPNLECDEPASWSFRGKNELSFSSRPKNWKTQNFDTFVFRESKTAQSHRSISPANLIYLNRSVKNENNVNLNLPSKSQGPKSQKLKIVSSPKHVSIMSKLLMAKKSLGISSKPKVVECETDNTVLDKRNGSMSTLNSSDRSANSFIFSSIKTQASNNIQTHELLFSRMTLQENRIDLRKDIKRDTYSPLKKSSVSPMKRVKNLPNNLESFSSYLAACEKTKKN